MNTGGHNTNSARLRTGFTTGSYASATAVAAWSRLQGLDVGSLLDVVFPDGRIRKLNIDGTLLKGASDAEAWAVKDAGDDVDVTDKAVIRTRVRKIQPEDVRPEDFVLPCGMATLILRGGEGVGLVTRLGLDVPPGKWAVNPAPRRMIAHNMQRAGVAAHKGTWLVEISIISGERIAKRTLNPVIGIEGGLSILGTSGLVIPASNAAYVATIRILIRGAAHTGCDRVALVTGGRTHRWLKKAYPVIPEHAFVRIGDFIRKSLGYCSEFRIKTAIVGCMPGKLAKYALGHEYTHAHKIQMSMPAISELLIEKGVPADVAERCRGCATVREYLESLSANEHFPVLHVLHTAASANFAKWAPGVSCEIIVFGPKGEIWI